MPYKELILACLVMSFIPCWSSRRQNKRVPDCTNGMYLDGIFYEREILFYHVGKPFNLVLHKYSGTIFFSYTVTNRTHIDFKISACFLLTRVCFDVPGIPGGYAVAYDSNNDDIYFGGHDGIYKYSYITRDAEFFAEDGKSILDIFVKKHFYYVSYPSRSLFVYNGNKFVPVVEALGIRMERFFIADTRDIYFSNDTGLCKIERIGNSLIVLGDEMKVRQIAQDKFGDIYIASDKGLFVEMKPGMRLKKLVHIDQMYGLMFDENDDIVYSDTRGIYRLRKSEDAVHCHFRRKYNVSLGP